jgi:hypothetical protein
MAACITPKSEIRMINSIIVGYGEVPVAHLADKAGWALPGNRFTSCPKEASDAAARLDRVIRQNTKKTNAPNYRLN